MHISKDGKPVLDRVGECVSIDPASGLVRIDGFPVFKVVVRSDGIFVQFADNDRMRSNYRGTRFIEVPLECIVDRIRSACT